jgi:hypothetical protein
VERSRKHLRSPHPGFSFVALFTKEKSPLCAHAQRNSSANPQRAEKPENKGVDKTAIRKDAFHVNQTVFSEEDSQKNRSKKRHPKKSGRKCMQGRGENPQYAPILLPISYHSKPKMSRASLFSISISSIPIYTRVTIFCRFAALLPHSCRAASSRPF